MNPLKLLFGLQLLLITAPLAANATDLTLSDSALLCLDWHDPAYKAKVVSIRNVPGPGVEFEVRFYGKTHPNQGLHQWLIGMALSSGRSAADAIRDADEIIRAEPLVNSEAEKKFSD